MRVSFLIDGFNLYHSIEDLNKSNGSKTRWLDIKTMLHSFLGAIDKTAKFKDVYFFTAIREHVQLQKPQSIERHKRYISILETKNIQVVYGGFKPKSISCKNCKSNFIAYEEKKTDVAIASKIIEIASNGTADAIGIVSGDTDLIPAIELAKSINPNIEVIIFFPFKRTNDELKQYADKSFSLKPKNYTNSQFQGIVSTPNGDIAKPSHW